jgi:16S rRNA (guanine527-N7)-methyltransferase
MGGTDGALAGPHDAVTAVLERSRSLGYLGPGSVRVAAAHAAGFAVGIDEPPAHVLDLGSGGGVPGLVLAAAWPAARVVLLDASERRVAFLEEAVSGLGWQDRVEVLRARAEDAGRAPARRGAFDLVVARGFGPPPVTAECGAPFLRVGGRLIVSEPPAGPSRWPEDGLSLVGLAAERTWDEPYSYRSFVLTHECPDRFPRRVGVPAKRPLF